MSLEGNFPQIKFTFCNYETSLQVTKKDSYSKYYVIIN